MEIIFGWIIVLVKSLLILVFIKISRLKSIVDMNQNIEIMDIGTIGEEVDRVHENHLKEDVILAKDDHDPGDLLALAVDHIAEEEMILPSAGLDHTARELHTNGEEVLSGAGHIRSVRLTPEIHPVS